MKHFTEVSGKASETANALGRLLPNIGGPSGRVRKLYTAVIQAILLYGALIWAMDLKKEPNNVRKIRAVHRKILLRIIRGYNTVSCTTAGLLARVPPITYYILRIPERKHTRGRERSGTSE